MKTNKMINCINSTVILDSCGRTFKYSAYQMFTDDSYVLNVIGASLNEKAMIKQHVEELYNVKITVITKG